MKVFFTAPYIGKEKYQKYYGAIVNEIQKYPLELIATELGNYKNIIKGQIFDTKREEHYYAIKKGIEWADLVILEITTESFQVGHEASLAMLAKKHVLGLSLDEDWDRKIINPYFHGSKYSLATLPYIIKIFIENYSNQKLSERFNLFLSKQQIEKLDRIAKKEGVNKSEIIRKLIQKL